MGVEVLEFRLIKGGFDGVVAGGFIGGIPIGNAAGTGDHVNGVAFLGKFRVINGLAGLGFIGVDFAGPAWDGNASAGYAAGAFILGVAQERGASRGWRLLGKKRGAWCDPFKRHDTRFNRSPGVRRCFGDFVWTIDIG